MNTDRLNEVLCDALLVEPHAINYDLVLVSLREFRSAIASEGTNFQLSVLNHNSLIDNLVRFVDKMFNVISTFPQSGVLFNVGVQCIVNLMSNNDRVRSNFADRYVKLATSWLNVEDIKSKNYVAALLLNTDQVNGLDEELKSLDFVRSLIDVSQSEIEFGVLLLQNLVRKRHFKTFYEAADGDQKLFILQLLESVISETDDEFVEDVVTVIRQFKTYCDNMMSSLPNVGPSTAHELATMLDLLASVSCKKSYMGAMQGDSSLVITTSYLLRGIHECFSQNKSWKESQREAVELIQNNNPELTKRPFFGVKGNLIRLLGNLVYKNKENQDQAREAGCLPIILDSCKLDGENPFLKEWSILTIRNLCDGNTENQQFIKQMTFEGYNDLTLASDSAIKLDGNEGGEVNIAPLVRR